MKELKYSIIMQTPVGKRYGFMSATILGSRIKGTIELLQHVEPFDGMIEANGNCKISGRIISLKKNIDYTGFGKITPTDVQLFLQGENNTFEISGVTSLFKGENPYGQIL